MSYIGTNKIKSVYIGTQKIKSVYVGTQKVFSSDNEYKGLCFTSLMDNSMFQLVAIGNPPIANTQYSYDGVNWNNYTLRTAITLNLGEKVYMRNDITGDFNENNYLRFRTTGKISLSGNINSLHSSTNFETLTQVRQFCYFQLFTGCPITTAPEFPATQLSMYCYNETFYGCELLRQAPSVLPATTLVEGCYQSMFQGCILLEEPPKIYGNTYGDYALFRMFKGCTSLNTMPKMYSKEIYDMCDEMFNGCSSLLVNASQTSQAQYEWKIPESGVLTSDCISSNVFTNCLGSRANDNLNVQSGQSKTFYTQNQPI